MSIRDRIPDQAKQRVRNLLSNMRANAVELQEIAGEFEGLLGVFLEGVASRIINLIDIALGEVGK